MLEVREKREEREAVFDSWRIEYLRISSIFSFLLQGRAEGCI